MIAACESVIETETVAGPYDGYYLASYAVAADSGFITFTKICAARPDDIWDCKAVAKVASQCQPSVPAALSAALQAARSQIAWLSLQKGEFK